MHFRWFRTSSQNHDSHLPSLEYIEKAYDESKYGRPSANPMLEMTIPTTYDSTLAPAGKHVMNIFLQYTPYSLAKEVASGRHAIKESHADRVMDLIEEYAPGFKSLLLHRQVISPLDLEEVFVELGERGGSERRKPARPGNLTIQPVSEVRRESRLRSKS